MPRKKTKRPAAQDQPTALTMEEAERIPVPWTAKDMAQLLGWIEDCKKPDATIGEGAMNMKYLRDKLDAAIAEYRAEGLIVSCCKESPTFERVGINGARVRVACPECLACGPTRETKKAAVEGWNAAVEAIAASEDRRRDLREAKGEGDEGGETAGAN